MIEYLGLHCVGVVFHCVFVYLCVDVYCVLLMGLFPLLLCSQLRVLIQEGVEEQELLNVSAVLS